MGIENIAARYGIKRSEVNRNVNNQCVGTEICIHAIPEPLPRNQYVDLKEIEKSVTETAWALHPIMRQKVKHIEEGIELVGIKWFEDLDYYTSVRYNPKKKTLFYVFYELDTPPDLRYFEPMTFMSIFQEKYTEFQNTIMNLRMLL